MSSGGIDGYYSNNYDGKIAWDGYWDFTLCSDYGQDINVCSYALNPDDECTPIEDGLVLWFDLNNTATTVDGQVLCSLTEWDEAKIVPASGLTINDIGLTGIDNGRVMNLSGESLTFTSADTKVKLYLVTGYTITESGTTAGKYIYPTRFNINVSGSSYDGDTCFIGNTISLAGGFYQGFFKIDFDAPAPKYESETDKCGNTTQKLVPQPPGEETYELMPIDYPDGWTIETCLYKHNNFIPEQTGTTLNDVYSGNSGFFFYIGTRAENKFSNEFSGETGIFTSTGLPLSPTEEIKVENISGVDWTIGSTVFGLTDCLCPCQICDENREEVSGSTIPCEELTDNVLGFLCTDDGRIGYRKIAGEYDCLGSFTGYTIEEGLSEPNTVHTASTWNHIIINYTPGGVNEYGLDSGTLKFFINGRNLYQVEEFSNIFLRALNEHSDKQQGVPFNVSWGGGTQGLIETNTFNGPDFADFELLIEENFAGSFIGDINGLRFYKKTLNLLEIRNNFFCEYDKCCRSDTFGGVQTIIPNHPNCKEC